MHCRKTLLTLALVCLAGCSGMTIRAKDIVVDNPAQAIADAEKLMAEQARDPDRTNRLSVEQAPASLRIKGLKYVEVFPDHLNLVVYREPDVQHGARIWKKGSSRPHADHPTKYPGITFYRYNSDLPDGPENIP